MSKKTVAPPIVFWHDLKCIIFVIPGTCSSAMGWLHSTESDKCYNISDYELPHGDAKAECEGNGGALLDGWDQATLADKNLITSHMYIILKYT